MAFTYNENKIVKIKSNSEVYTGSNNWKNNIARILKEQGKSTSDTTLFNNLGRNLTVHNKVELLMEKDPPQIKLGIEGEGKRPIQAFLTGGGSTGNALLDQVSSVVSKGVSAASDAYNIMSAINNSTGLANGVKNPGTADTFFPWYTNVPSWDPDSVHGQNFEYDFEFKIGQYGLWNAKEEVVLPILNLIVPAMPREISSMTVSGSFPTTIQLLANIVSGTIGDLVSGNINLGDTLTSAITAYNDNRESGGGVVTSALEGASAGLQEIGETLGQIITGSYNQFTYDVSFGNVTTYKKCLIMAASADYSKETDEEGYPVSGKVHLKFHSMIPTAMVFQDETQRAIRFGVDN